MKVQNVQFDSEITVICVILVAEVTRECCTAVTVFTGPDPEPTWFKSSCEVFLLQQTLDSVRQQDDSRTKQIYYVQHNCT